MRICNTRSVIASAITPSLNASSRCVVALGWVPVAPRAMSRRSAPRVWSWWPDDSVSPPHWVRARAVSESAHMPSISHRSDSPPTSDEIVAVARGLVGAVAPADGLTDSQASVLHAITLALTDTDIDYAELEPIGPDELAAVLDVHGLQYRQRIVHHMILGELVLRPLPAEVAERVALYSAALGVDDSFVHVARRYAKGAFGLAWMDLRRSGFDDRWDPVDASLHSQLGFDNPFESRGPDPELEAAWEAFGT